MALGGGTFLVQNKILPGAYINFVSVAKASATLSDRGFATIPMELDWGPENRIFTVEQGDFQKNSQKIFGYSYTDDKLLPMREIFCHATTVYFFNLLKGGKKAAASGAGLKVTAKYPGIRGNDLSYTVEKNDDGTFNVLLRLGTAIVSEYSNLTSAEQLFDQDDPYVVFSTPIKEAPADNAVKAQEPEAGDDLGGVKVADLQKDISFETDGTTAYVTGTLKYVSDYKAYGGTPGVEEEKKGNYFAFSTKNQEHTHFRTLKNGKEKLSKRAKDDDLFVAWVKPGDTVTIELYSSEETLSKVLTYDFSRTTFENADGTTTRLGEQLEPAARVFLTDGSNGQMDDSAYQTYLDQAESYTFNAMGCPSNKDTVKKLFTSYCERMRDDVGKKFQVVVFRDLDDYEGVVSLKNGLQDDKDNPALIPWLTGVVAGTAVNESATNMVYDGEYQVDTDYTQTELEKGITEGSFMFHKVDDDVKTLRDINTFVSVTDTKSIDFSMNQVIRVLDQIANDIAVLFGKKYIGKVPNDASGRVSLWSDIVAHHKQLETIRAIQDFNSENVIVEAGDTKEAVVVSDTVNPTAAMEKLYMTVYVQ